MVKKGRPLVLHLRVLRTHLLKMPFGQIFHFSSSCIQIGLLPCVVLGRGKWCLNSTQDSHSEKKKKGGGVFLKGGVKGRLCPGRDGPGWYLKRPSLCIWQ